MAPVDTTRSAATLLALQRTLALDGVAPPFIAAASGAVVVARRLWVVADDELVLGRFDIGGAAPGRAFAVLPGALPEEPKARKAQKPDHETLTFVPAISGLSAGLLALGSGSRPNRERGVLQPLTDTGDPSGPAHTIDFARVYRRLRVSFSELNIEGATLVGGALLLAQRGNGAREQNGLAWLDWPMVAAALARGAPAPEAAVREVKRVELPCFGGTKTRLSFTDLCGLPDGRVVFTAAAEASPSTYDDGAVLGSVIGVMDSRGVVLATHEVPALKLEGVHAELAPDGRISVLVVTDGDDPTRPAGVYSGRV